MAYYINNKEFHGELVKYMEKLKKAKEDGKPDPDIGSYIGKAIWDIADRYSTKYKFRNYIFREDMVADAVENCVKYLYNYDVNRSNPLAYFTQIVHFSFLRTIDKEKKYLYTKFKNIERFNLFENATDRQIHDEFSSYGTADDLYSATSTQENMNIYIEDYERKKKEKGLKNAAKKKEATRISDESTSDSGKLAETNEELQGNHLHSSELL